MTQHSYSMPLSSQEKCYQSYRHVINESNWDEAIPHNHIMPTIYQISTIISMHNLKNLINKLHDHKVYI